MKLINGEQLEPKTTTVHQSSDPSGVLDGNLNPFIEASLAHRLEGGTADVEVEDAV